jgi:hypothetical protein
MLIKDLIGCAVLKKDPDCYVWSGEVDPVVNICTSLLIFIADSCYIAGDIPAENSIKNDEERTDVDHQYANDMITADGIYYPGDTISNAGQIVTSLGTILVELGKKMRRDEGESPIQIAVETIGKASQLFGWAELGTGNDLQICSYSYQIRAQVDYLRELKKAEDGLRAK